MDFKSVNLSTIVLENVDMRDYPDFADAMAVEGYFKSGRKMSESELEALTAEGSIVQELAHQSMF